MGRAWDAFVPQPALWREVLRVLKPGGHALVFAGSRTVDIMGLSLRIAGFEVRDQLQWVYGSGFPKSLDVSKAIASGGGRPEDIRRMMMGDAYVPSKRGRVNYDHGGGSAMNGVTGEPPLNTGWEGWGTALKPAHEPIILARKPLAGTVAKNVQAFGTGALNIDGCRIESAPRPVMVRTTTEVAATAMSGKSTGATSNGDVTSLGRWPANVILDEDAAAALDEQSGTLTSGSGAVKRKSGRDRDGNTSSALGKESRPEGTPIACFGDSGGASRFFYCPKVSPSERGDSTHPTMKPVALMRWLVRLVTPPGGLVLDPFMGSGSTGVAAAQEGFGFVGVEMEAESFKTARSRLEPHMDALSKTAAKAIEVAQTLGAEAFPTDRGLDVCVEGEDALIDLVTKTAVVRERTIEAPTGQRGWLSRLLEETVKALCAEEGE